MNHAILLSLGIALFIAGAVLLVFGLNESESFSSDVSRVFTGNPSDRAMQLIVGGIGLGVVGAALALFSFRKAK